MPAPILTVGASVLWFVALAWALTRSFDGRAQGETQSRSRVTHWLVSCLLSSLGYVALSLRLDLAATVPVWLDGLRWGLFGVALYTFVRYRLARKQGT